MNIIVKTLSENIIFRPDTTLNRENSDYYVPSFINTISFSPILFARISKTGKYIAEKFAERYYDAINYGILLYPQDILDKKQEGSFAQANCLCNTSILPIPLYNPITLKQEQNTFCIKKNGNIIYEKSNNSHNKATKVLIHDALCKASLFTTFRIGDFIAIELEKRELLVQRIEEYCNLQTFYCANCSSEQKILF